MTPGTSLDTRDHHNVVNVGRLGGSVGRVGLGMTIVTVNLTVDAVVIKPVDEPARGNHRISSRRRCDRIVRDRIGVVALHARGLDPLARGGNCRRKGLVGKIIAASRITLSTITPFRITPSHARLRRRLAVVSRRPRLNPTEQERSIRCVISRDIRAPWRRC